jgi:Zn-dependent protease
MLTRFELGRITGIPIYLDMMLVLVLMVFGWRYFTSGDMQLVSAGLLIVAGLILSILLHELGHAFAGRLFGVKTREIELMGLGGLARFESALPRSVLARTVIYLAGPAVNLGLWYGFAFLAAQAAGIDRFALLQALFVLSIANFWLMAFNLLPAYPLDGGRTLDAWLSPLMGPVWATRIVAGLGIAICAGVAWMALPYNLWMLLLAFILFQANWSALSTVSRFRS